MDMDKYLDLFVSEANEHIQAAGRQVGKLSGSTPPAESLNALFRHFHSIKGMAASMGFAQIASLSHAVEDLFDIWRKRGEVGGIQAQVPDLIQEALDAIGAMVAEAGARSAGAQLSLDPAPLIGRIRACIPAAAAAPARSSPVTPPAQAAPHAPAGPPERHYRCTLVVDPRADLVGARAAIILARLQTLGRIVSTTPDRDHLRGRQFDGEVSILLATRAPQSAVLTAAREQLDVLRFDLREEIAASAPPGGVASDDLPAPRATPASGASLEPSAATLRVSTATLDDFLDSISELITCRGALSEAIRVKDFPVARASLGRMSESIDRLRERVMRIRLIPFDHITPRLTRAVRELCRSTGKRVSLQISGSDVSLDRSVLEEIIDPMLHILRNAVDHGIAAPAERAAAGRPPDGTIRVEVARSADRILLSVEDDGRGMDPEAIRRKALEGGFATREELAAMDEDRVLMMTTIPGFSTAGSVTEISGRGVGMDVVRTRVEALHGHMRIRSRPGEGTRIEMNLPPTVAVVDAFLVDCGTAGPFALPADAVSLVREFDPSEVRTTVRGRYLASRAATPGEPEAPDFLPLLMLDEALGLTTSRAERSPSGRVRRPGLQGLVYSVKGTTGVLGVDRVHERREVVVKPLGAPLERLRKYSGAALLDDGRVALMLDLANLGSVA